MARTSNNKTAGTTEHKKLCLNTAKEAKKGVLTGLCQQIEEATHASGSDHIPYGTVQEIVNDLKETISMAVKG